LKAGAIVSAGKDHDHAKSSNHSGNAKFARRIGFESVKSVCDSLVVGLIDDRGNMTHQQIHFRQQVDPERRARF
jgi:hypothetical protein